MRAPVFHPLEGTMPESFSLIHLVTYLRKSLTVLPRLTSSWWCPPTLPVNLPICGLQACATTLGEFIFKTLRETINTEIPHQLQLILL